MSYHIVGSLGYAIPGKGGGLDEVFNEPFHFGFMFRVEVTGTGFPFHQEAYSEECNWLRLFLSGVTG